MSLLNGRKLEGGMPQKIGRADERGFTLIETSIALVVMMIIALAVASLFVYAIKYNSGANDRLISLAIAQQRMERLRKTPFTDAVFSTDTTTETVTNASRTYNIVTTVCSTSTCGGSSSLKLITVQVAPLGATGQWSSTPVSVTALRATQTVGANY